MPVVGTAGHVDHGKSTLVQALTGLDPDRWAEEKARGLTIDLGFAWTQLAGHEVSFVDVPGHEQFIKNMLAGIESIDVALFVVAADEGWMPQSEEHLAVLDLLDVRLGVVALSKVDRVDGDLADLAELEVGEHLESTSLAEARIIRVSATRGDGLDELRSELGRLLAMVDPRETGRPRMWIDRAFSISGAGTVVTGTLLDSRVSTGDDLHVWPADRPVRVRSVQSHEQTVDSAGPRRRVALNLAGVDRDEITRGSMLGRSDQWVVSNRCHVLLRPARYVEEISDRGAYHVHIGSGSWPGRVRMLTPSEAIVSIDSPLPLAMGDRVILRDTGRRLVVGGGIVLDPDPPTRARDITAHSSRLLGAMHGSADERATALLAARGIVATNALSARSGGGVATESIIRGDLSMSLESVTGTAEAVRTTVGSFHRDNPLRPGMPIASLSSLLRIPLEAVEAAIEADDDLVDEGAIVRLGDFEVDRSHRDDEWEAARTVLESAGLSVPRVSDLDIDSELLHALVRDGELVRISQEFVFLPGQIEQIVKQLAGLEDGFTVSEFKDRTGLSRKYAVPFLEWADRTGLTVRSGDTRRVQSRKPKAESRKQKREDGQSPSSLETR